MELIEYLPTTKKDEIFSVLDWDFETRSIYDISFGSRAYSEHESTDILIIKYSIDGGERKTWLNPLFSRRYKTSVEIPRDLYIALTDIHCLIRAHNFQFERDIYSQVLVPKYNFPEEALDLRRWSCTMTESVRVAFPASLDDSAKAMLLENTKDHSGKKLIQKFSKPHRRKDKSDGIFNDPRLKEHRNDFINFMDYCDQDVLVQQNIHFFAGTLSLYERQAFELIETYNERGVYIDKEMVEGAIELAEQYKQKAKEEAQAIAGPDFNIGSAPQVHKWLATHNIALPDMTGETVRDVLLDGIKGKPVPEIVRTMLEAKKRYDKTSASKYKKALGCIAPSTGRIHGAIKYSVARTGRNGGRLIQIQNLTKSKLEGWVDYEYIIRLIKKRDYDTLEHLYGDVLNVLASLIRYMVCAPEGKEFWIIDLSQIECRLTFWYADDTEALDVFRASGDIYLEMAKTIYDKEDLTKEKNPQERFVGKEAVLSLGFGSGAVGFRNTTLKKTRIDLDTDLEKGITSKVIVDAYRKKHNKVVQAWKQCEKAFIKACKNPNMPVTILKGKVTFLKKEKHLVAILPSGRHITFPFAYIKNEEKWGKLVECPCWYAVDSYTNKWVKRAYYGAIIFQNIVQGTNADIVNEACIRLENLDFKGLFQVHDEVVSEVDSKLPKSAQQTYFNAFIKNPSWCKNLPISAEMSISKRYMK